MASINKVPFVAKIRNSQGGKYPNWVVTIPAQYVNNGLVTPGDLVKVTIERVTSEGRIERMAQTIRLEHESQIASEEPVAKASTADLGKSGFSVPRQPKKLLKEQKMGPAGFEPGTKFSFINNDGDVPGVLVTSGEWLNARAGTFSYSQEVFA